MSKSDIRRARPEDLPTLAAIWEEAVRATHDFLREEDFAYYRQMLPQYLEQTDVYICGDPATGFVGVSSEQIEMLFVRERGRGTGHRLLQFAIGELGATDVTVNEQNGHAAGFYLSHGFHITDYEDTDAEGKPYPVLHLSLVPDK